MGGVAALGLQSFERVNLLTHDAAAGFGWQMMRWEDELPMICFSVDKRTVTSDDLYEKGRRRDFVWSESRLC